jgi:hypothetical protein
VKALILIVSLFSSLLSVGIAGAVVRGPKIKNCYNEPNAFKGHFVLSLDPHLDNDQKQELEEYLGQIGLSEIAKLDKINGAPFWFVRAPDVEKVGPRKQAYQLKALEPLLNKQVLSVSCDYIRKAL